MSCVICRFCVGVYGLHVLVVVLTMFVYDVGRRERSIAFESDFVRTCFLMVVRDMSSTGFFRKVPPGWLHIRCPRVAAERFPQGGCRKVPPVSLEKHTTSVHKQALPKDEQNSSPHNAPHKLPPREPQ